MLANRPQPFIWPFEVHGVSCLRDYAGRRPWHQLRHSYGNGK